MLEMDRGRNCRHRRSTHYSGLSRWEHLTTLPILRAVTRVRPVRMIHFEAHSDTNDSYFGDNPIRTARLFGERSKKDC